MPSPTVAICGLAFSPGTPVTFMFVPWVWLWSTYCVYLSILLGFLILLDFCYLTKGKEFLVSWPIFITVVFLVILVELGSYPGRNSFYFWFLHLEPGGSTFQAPEPPFPPPCPFSYPQQNLKISFQSCVTLNEFVNLLMLSSWMLAASAVSNAESSASAWSHIWGLIGGILGWLCGLPPLTFL